MKTNVRPSAFAYTANFVALVVLATLSLGLSRLDLAGAALPLALGIAALKALLVALFFMHLSAARASVRLTACLALLFLAVFVGLVAADVVTREPTKGHAPPRD